MAQYDAGAVDQMFNQMLGRPATKAEHDFLTPYVNNGQISNYEIGQYLQGTPEAQQARLGQQQGQFQNLLTQNNQQILNQAANTANGQFAQNGRQWSSGQGNSILQAGQQLASQQSPMIAQNYMAGQSGLNDLYSNYGNNALNRTYNLADSQTAYNRAMQSYYNQQNDFNNYLGGQQTRNMQSGLFNAGISIPGQVIGAAGRMGKLGF